MASFLSSPSHPIQTEQLGEQTQNLTGHIYSPVVGKHIPVYPQYMCGLESMTCDVKICVLQETERRRQKGLLWPQEPVESCWLQSVGEHTAPLWVVLEQPGPHGPSTETRNRRNQRPLWDKAPRWGENAGGGIRIERERDNRGKGDTRKRRSILKGLSSLVPSCKVWLCLLCSQSGFLFRRGMSFLKGYKCDSKGFLDIKWLIKRRNV